VTGRRASSSSPFLSHPISVIHEMASARPIYAGERWIYRAGQGPHVPGVLVATGPHVDQFEARSARIGEAPTVTSALPRTTRPYPASVGRPDAP
jgi:hypothetical protein